MGRSDMAERYERLLESPGVRLIPSDRESALNLHPNPAGPKHPAAGRDSTLMRGGGENGIYLLPTMPVSAAKRFQACSSSRRWQARSFRGVDMLDDTSTVAYLYS